MLLTQKNAKYGKKKKWIMEVKHRKNIYSWNLGENLVVTTTYANVAKSTNNSTQNQGMTHYEMINLIKELKTLRELLRESLNNLTTKPHPDQIQRKTSTPCKIIRDAQVKNRNVSAANQLQILIGWKELKWKCQKETGKN